MYSLLLPRVQDSFDKSNVKDKKSHTNNKFAKEDQNRMNKALKYAREKLKQEQENEVGKPRDHNENKYDEINFDKLEENPQDFIENIQKMKSRIQYHAIDRQKK